MVNNNPETWAGVDVLVNYGSGTIDNAQEGNAIDNIRLFVKQLKYKASFIRVSAKDEGGRYAFDISFEDYPDKEIDVLMPGVPYQELLNDGLNCPRIFVTGNSFYLEHAINNVGSWYRAFGHIEIGAGSNEDEEIVCLACGTRQQYPKHIGWCINCFSKHLDWYGDGTESGDVYIVLVIQWGETECIDILSWTMKLAKRYKFLPYAPTEEYGIKYSLIHTFPSDNVFLSIELLLDVLVSSASIPLLNECEVNYIKTITRFEDGKFYFKGESSARGKQ